MAAHSHDHHYTETKPVAFTVPFILAAVTILAMGLFLSLCDPEPHGHHNAAAGHGQHAAASTHHETAGDQTKGHESTVPAAHGEAPAEDAAHH